MKQKWTGHYLWFVYVCVLTQWPYPSVDEWMTHSSWLWMALEAATPMLVLLVHSCPVDLLLPWTKSPSAQIWIEDDIGWTDDKQEQTPRSGSNSGHAPLFVLFTQFSCTHFQSEWIRAPQLWGRAPMMMMMMMRRRRNFSYTPPHKTRGIDRGRQAKRKSLEAGYRQSRERVARAAAGG